MREQQGPEFPEPDRCEFCGQTFEPFWGPFWYGGFWLCEGCYDDYSQAAMSEPVPDPEQSGGNHDRA
jgi:hypothetical protein